MLVLSTPMYLFVHYKNLYEHSNVGKMMSYGSLSHMSSFFMIEDVRTGPKRLASPIVIDLQCTKPFTSAFCFSQFTLLFDVYISPSTFVFLNMPYYLMF